MSRSKKLTPEEELSNIEDGIIDSILSARGASLRDEIASANHDPEGFIAGVEQVIKGAIVENARRRLDSARAEFEAWRCSGRQAEAEQFDLARAKFERLRTGDPALKKKMMLAARKGEGPSDADLNVLIENLTALEKLEAKKEDE